MRSNTMRDQARWTARQLIVGVGVLLLLGGFCGASEVLDARRHYLGFSQEREWRDEDGRQAEGPSLELKFQAHANQQPARLTIAHRDVKLRWPVLLNGRRLGFLVLEEVPIYTALELPAGALREGENVLSVLSPGATDDVEVGPIKLDSSSSEQPARAGRLSVHVTDAQSRAGIPCRITLVDADGFRPATDPAPEQTLAARPGAIYTVEGVAEIDVAPGAYTVYATRGPEYGVAEQKVTVVAGQQQRVDLEIGRQVQTPGLVSCDTHIHTFTLSKHGDASLDERLLTIAGEGLEFAIASDHNLYADYAGSPLAKRLAPFFTWVTGDEVTTTVGHFIAFPVTKLDAPQPDVKLTDWPKLMAQMRAIPGNQVVVLNHPRDTHNGFLPFASENFNAVTGDNLRGPDFTFDAIEVCNSGTLQSDFMQSFRDWFALLNHGYRVTAVGSSDSHDVSRFIVGQGRTLIAGNDADPASIDVNEMCSNLKAGRAYVSMGLVTKLTVEGKYAAGDLVTGAGKEIHVHVEVQGPAWIQADRVELFANGQKIREATISPTAQAMKFAADWVLPKPAHDTYLVAVASGPGVREPYWNISLPYQPTDRVRHPRVIGANNPVWVDADGDGAFTSPRGYAAREVEKAGGDFAKLVAALAEYDEATAAQAASLYRVRGLVVDDALLEKSAPQVRRGFAAFAATVR